MQTIVEIPMETEPEASDAPNEPAEEEEAAAEAETSEDQAADTETPEDAPAPSPVAPTKISKAPIKPLVTRKAGFAAPKKVSPTHPPNSNNTLLFVPFNFILNIELLNELIPPLLPFIQCEERSSSSSEQACCTFSTRQG